MTLFWLLYGSVTLGAFVFLTGTTVEYLKHAHHIPQPKTGILIILKSLFWPLALFVAGISWAFQSGVPKPIQDPPKAEPEFLQPPKGSAS